MWFTIISIAAIAASIIHINESYASEYEESNFDCESEMDCSLLGDCDKDTHKCICDLGWTGDHCEKAHLLPTNKNKGFVDPTLPSWGLFHPILLLSFFSILIQNCDFVSFYQINYENEIGGDVLYADGEYHMFAEYMESRCHIWTYGTNSGVLHAVASEPDGLLLF